MLSYKIIGKGKPIILLHGFLENSKMWQFITNKFVDYQLVMIDLAGHGKSKNFSEKHTMELQAQKVKEVIENENISSAFFIGHSMGGYVALAFYDLFPEMVKGITMFFSTTFPDSDEKKAQRRKAAETAQKNPDTFIKVSISNLFNQNNLENIQNEINIARTWARETSVKGITAALLGMRERDDKTKLIQDAKIPVQFICGTFDQAINSNLIKQTFENYKNIEYNELPIGHMGQLESPEKCKNLIYNFIKKFYL